MKVRRVLSVLVRRYKWRILFMLAFAILPLVLNLVTAAPKTVDYTLTTTTTGDKGKIPTPDINPL